MNGHSGWRRRGAVLLAALAILVTACGTRLDTTAVAKNEQFGEGPSGQTSNTPTLGASPTVGGANGGRATPGSNVAAPGPRPLVYDPGITDEEVRIGVTSPLSGIIGFMGEETAGPINAFFKLTTAERGGIGGRRLRVISYDDRADPAQALANVKRLVEQDKVFMVVGTFTDSALEYVRQKNVPLMTFGGTAPPFSSKYPTVFPLLGNALTFQQEGAYALVNHAGKRPKRVAVLYDTQTFDLRGYLDYFRQTWSFLGAEVVSMDPLNLSDGDCTSLASKVRRLEIDYWDFNGLGWLHCMTAMERLGWRPPMGVGGWVTALAEFGNIVGPSIANVWGPSTGDLLDGSPRTKTAAHSEYRRAIATYAPAINNDTNMQSPQTIGMWVGAKLIVDGLIAIAPTFTRRSFVDWMHGIKNFDVGIQPPIKSFAANCKRGSGGTWWAHWKWDSTKKEAFRSPETPYLGGFWADRYGGVCFVTKVADKIAG
ncbi:MAG: ABC transporter substrate-binding protein [Actinomycetota bacterium]